jgi:hypothetical protein
MYQVGGGEQDGWRVDHQDGGARRHVGEAGRHSREGKHKLL